MGVGALKRQGSSWPARLGGIALEDWVGAVTSRDAAMDPGGACQSTRRQP